MAVLAISKNYGKNHKISKLFYFELLHSYCFNIEHSNIPVGKKKKGLALFFSLNIKCFSSDVVLNSKYVSESPDQSLQNVHFGAPSSPDFKKFSLTFILHCVKNLPKTLKQANKTTEFLKIWCLA